jgi:hypothetical protein
MDLLFYLGLGMVAGTLGGLLGIGGSVIMIPALLFFAPTMSIHVAQAIAMSVNPAVAVSSAAKHHKNKNVSWNMAVKVLPISILFVSIAAWFSNSIDGAWLEFAFATFLIWVLWDQVACVVGKPLNTTTPTSASILRCSVTGGVTGATAGFLGIGGGLIQVPLLNRLCKLPIKRAIGTSSAIMFATAIIGASVKDITLQDTDHSGFEALMFACKIIPGAILGGWLGAKLTRVLPSKAIRIVFAILVVIASIKMFLNSIPILF